ncbi:MAG TPA: hypothetical protein VFX92_06885 [Candidatus Krumholzibacteria bacterium]|nr:hypothetical protein [Candidatus Krumholzibacteria bacterium]
MQNRVAAVALAAAIAAAWTGVCHAYFENALLSARTASLGGAFVALADDPSAAVDNPAGMAGIYAPSFLFTYQRPYGVAGLNEGFVAAVIPVRVVTLGAGWFHRGLDGALSEDRLTVSAARDLKRTSEDASLSVGVAVDVARVSASAGFDDAATAVGAGASVLLRPFAFIGIGYNARSLNQPDIDLVAGGGVTALRREQALGLSYYWQDRLTVTVETHESADGSWRPRGGFELQVSNHLALRGGIDGTRAAAGFGAGWHGVELDAAMRSHETLGASYLLSVRYSRPRPEVPYGTR